MTTGNANDGTTVNAPHFIEGIIVGRRSMGRKLAFADVVLNLGHDDASSALNDNTNTSSGNNANDGHNNVNGSVISIIFLHQAFLGGQFSSSSAAHHDGKHTLLDEPFPTKMTALPYGANIVAELGNCQKVPSKDGTGRVDDVWEVSRWKIKKDPRELAEQLASLEVVSDTTNESESNVEETSQRQRIDQQQPRSQENNVQQKQQQTVMGTGALSCSTYLKLRGEAYASAKQQQHNKVRQISETTTSDKAPDYKVSNITSTRNDDDGHNLRSYGTKMKPSMSSDDTSTTTTNNAKNETNKSIIGNITDSEFHHGGKHAKAKRAKIFASWVLETFFGIVFPSQSLVVGDDFMKNELICQPCNNNPSEEATKTKPPSTQSSGVHVLDIAGGKGQLSLELIVQQMMTCGDTTKDALLPITQCTIIDPMVRKGDAKQRQSKLKRAKSRMNWLRQQRQQGQAEYKAVQDDETQSYTTDEANSINHLATCFDAKSFTKLHSQCVKIAGWEQTSQSLSSGDSMLLLGLHPDQCTECIIDAALEHNLSVAIVPCCVYPGLFPHRRMMLPKKTGSITSRGESIKSANGTLLNSDAKSNNNPTEGGSADGAEHNSNSVPVRTYDEFIQYLMNKDDQLQMAELPFEGKNKVIYKRVS